MSFKEEQKILELFETFEEKNIKLAFQLIKSLKLDYSILSEYLDLVQFLENHGRLNPNGNVEKVLLDLHKLKFLSIPYSKLKVLPTKIHFLVNLEDLNLEHNDFTIFPESICKLPNLKRLNLAFNNLNNFPKNTGNLSELESLDLSSNKLKQIPLCIYKLKQSTFLSIQNNPLSECQSMWIFNNFPNSQINHWHKS
ncbi:MAG: Unknown protein [uncultured Aureispira sp.]|uniref:Leucine-rich repeat containing protein n=1 Tax=uncultured Aureispira sp. TaxID=1331704 RepID=A0A6S6U377_9BACT|nr:MAG: Unknown protein [uncultured Aureispira sp.]